MSNGCAYAMLGVWALEAIGFVLLGLIFGVGSMAGSGKGKWLAAAFVFFTLGITQLVPIALILKRRIRLQPDRVEESILGMARGTDGTVTTSEVAGHVGFSPEDATEALERMVAQGVAERQGQTEWLIKGVVARKVTRECPYCGASLPIRQQVLVCPGCGGSIELERDE